MNYEILAKTLFVRKKFSRSIWKSELVVINSDAGFVKVDTSNLVEAVIRKLKTSVPFMISPSSHWVRLFFFSRRYNEVKQFKRYFVSLSRMSSSLSFATRLKSLRFCAAFLTRVCSFSIWHLWRFFHSSLLQQKIHSFKVFLKSRLFFFFFFALFFIFKFMLQLPDLSPFSFSFNFCFQLCLLYAAIHDLWNKALFSGKTSASADLFCRALYLLFKAFGQPSKLRNSFELSAIVWNKLFSGSKPEKQILRVKHKFPITDFAFSSLKMSKNNMNFL